MTSFINFINTKATEIGTLTLKHLNLTLSAVLLAILIGVPIGILISKYKKAAPFVIGIANILQAVPSLALLGFLIPVIGIGEKPSILMVFLYSLLPIIKNTYTSLDNIDKDLIEAGKAMGMTNYQLLTQVKLPLAFPVIMAGVRISSVTAVGLMTIAAYVGAGGLGEYIFTGIQTLNNNMILAGAIPACILALLVDFLIGKIEKNAYSKNHKKSKKAQTIQKFAFSIILILLVVFGLSNYSKNKKTVVIGCKNYTEQKVLANLMAEKLKNDTSLNIKTKLDLGGAAVTFEAIKQGDIDIYPEYTGVALIHILKRPSCNDPTKVYNIVQKDFNKKYNLQILKPFGYNNTYALAVKKDTANEYKLNNVSDLTKVSNNLTAGFTLDFADRNDGLPGLEKKYGLEFNEKKKMDSGIRYRALQSGETDVTDAFTTDGLLKALNLKVLDDDQNFFPPYYAVPLIRQDILNKYPEIKKSLNKLGDTISEEDMIDMNYKVDKLNKAPKDVAVEFLKNKKLIK